MEEELTKETNELSFYAALKELEDRVKKLEDGQLPLEEALECFKEGIYLVRICNSKLKDSETVIRQLVEEEDGSISETVPEINRGGDFN